MSCPGDSDFHFWMTRSVGRCIGLNFSAALDEGRLSPERYRELVRSCQACPHVARCQRWLGSQRGVGTGAAAPDFCRNAGLLNALRPH